jgi:NAD(P)H-hydrate epimerase
MSEFWLSRDEVRELDRRAIEEYGVPGVVLMENAGRGCAELLMRLNPDKKPVVILCGPGNNGGDGFVIARHLDNYGWPVSVTGSIDLMKLPNDAAANYLTVLKSIGAPLIDPRDWDRLPHLRDQLLGRARQPCWIIDALFGTGLTRPLSTPYSVLVEAVNASGNPVLSVDIPSGLDCDTGEPLGPTVRATHTATFVAPKKGFLNPKSREWTGEVHVIDIGAPRKLVDEFRRLRGEPGASAMG